jgi:large subunit ribosomal protein L18
MAHRREIRLRRHRRVRRRVAGTQARPRLNVFRSSRHMYAQVIDDSRGYTLAAASTMEADLRGGRTATVEAARKVGELVGRRALEAGVEQVVFDRGGYLYHGRVAAVAEGARATGLKF